MIGSIIMSRLILKKEIYSVKSIETAILAFRDIASITFFDQAPQFILQFSNCKADMDLTIKEFENYLIGLENL